MAAISRFAVIATTEMLRHSSMSGMTGCVAVWQAMGQRQDWAESASCVKGCEGSQSPAARPLANTWVNDRSRSARHIDG